MTEKELEPVLTMVCPICEDRGKSAVSSKGITGQIMFTCDCNDGKVLTPLGEWAMEFLKPFERLIKRC